MFFLRVLARECPSTMSADGINPFQMGLIYVPGVVILPDNPRAPGPRALHFFLAAVRELAPTMFLPTSGSSWCIPGPSLAPPPRPSLAYLPGPSLAYPPAPGASLALPPNSSLTFLALPPALLSLAFPPSPSL
ncbi:hypothetical protein M405DRAFT_933357 [Rhizopogon salebrosus TDB-379]|nr:hypothetical protein M405DRAFT_933357 [Rhizopogon salebrosus TDB-379]